MTELGDLNIPTQAKIGLNGPLVPRIKFVSTNNFLLWRGFISKVSRAPFSFHLEPALLRQQRKSALWIGLALAICAFSSPASSMEQSASDLLKKLLTQDISDEEWQSTEKQFQQLPVEATVRVLFPEMAKGIPDGWPYAAYNCSEPLHDRKVKTWGEYCVVDWLWCKKLTCAAEHEEVSKVLLELWSQPQPISDSGQMVLLSGLCNYGPAEEKIAGVFRDVRAKASLRTQAAVCLLHTLFTEKYHDAVVEFAQQSPPDSRPLLFRALISPYHQADSGTDPAVVRMGFAMLLDEAAKEAEVEHRGQHVSSYGQFIYATELDTYLRTGSVPDQKLPQYKGPEGVERWYRDSAMNARVWWSQHKDEYATESTKVNGNK